MSVLSFSLSLFSWLSLSIIVVVVAQTHGSLICCFSLSSSEPTISNVEFELQINCIQTKLVLLSLALRLPAVVELPKYPDFPGVL